MSLSVASRQQKESLPPAQQRLEPVLQSAGKAMQVALREQHQLLSDLTHSARNQFDRKVFNDAYSALMSKSEAILQSFLALLKAVSTGQKPLRNVSEDKAVRFAADELALVTDSELHYQLALEKSFNLACDGYDGLCISSGQRSLAKTMTLPCHMAILCAHPAAQAWIFQQALSSHSDCNTTKRILYRMVGARFFGLMRDLYERSVPLLTRIVSDCRAAPMPVALAPQVAPLSRDTTQLSIRIDDMAPQDYLRSMQIPVIRECIEGIRALLSHELAFHKLMRFTFASVMRKSMFYHGETSVQMKTVSDVYRRVMWSTQASGTEKGKHDVLRNLPGIVKDLRAVCEQFKVKQHVREHILSQMFKFHMQIMQGHDGALIEESPDMVIAVLEDLRGELLDT